MPPLISVIIPTFNRPELLRISIQSVLSQTFQEFEIIVINDGGSDVSEMISSYADNRIKLIQHEKNLGRSTARNAGLQIACGEYIAYLDDDDFYYPDHLEIHYQTLNNNNSQVSFSNGMKATYEFRNGVEKIVRKSAPEDNSFNRDLLFIENYIPSLCLVHRRNLLEKTGLFDISLSTHEDWDLWIRFALETDFIFIPEVTCEYRWQHSDSTLNLIPEKFLESRRIIYKRYNQHIANNTAIISAQEKQIKRQIDMLEVIKSRQLMQAEKVAEKSEKNEYLFEFPESWISGESLKLTTKRLQEYLQKGKIKLVISIIEKDMQGLDEYESVLYELKKLLTHR